MLGRLVHRADYERLLASPPRWRSTHFAMHHVAEGSIAQSAVRQGRESELLSTDDSPTSIPSVDNSSGRVYLGVMVPKRHARRAVTRNLMRRLARTIFQCRLSDIPAGHWLVRLKAPFAPREFVSASSHALAQAVRAELERLVDAVVGCPAKGAAG